jgi:WD40 repeat protein
MAVLVLLSSVARTQAYQPPLEEIVLNSGAPSAPYDVLKFTSDGKTLIAAGEDKQVWQFPFDRGRISGAPPKVARWPLFRDQKGMIYTVALPPDGKSSPLAVGGYGFTLGNLAILDTVTGQLMKALPAQDPVCVVWSTCFSPDGSKLAYGDDEGHVRIWSWRADQVTLLGERTPRNPSAAVEPRVLEVAYLSDDRLLSAGRDGVVKVWDLSKPRAEVVRTSRFERITVVNRVQITPDKKWVVATGSEPDAVASRNYVWHVHVMNVASGQVHTLPLPKYTVPQQFGLDHQSGRVAVCTAMPDEARAQNAGVRYKPVLSDTVYVCDLTDRSKPPAKLNFRSTYDIDRLAFHPDGQHLVMAGGENYELVVLDLQSGQVTDKLEQRGKGIWQVAYSQDGRTLGLRDRRHLDPSGFNHWGEDDWNVFHLRATRTVNLGWSKKPQDFKPVQPREQSEDGWEVVPDVRSNFVWHVRSPRGRLFRLPLDEKIDQQPRCYVFLTNQPGQPARLLVGHYLGATLFELDADRGPKKTRIYVGHTGAIMSLTVAPDEKSFITSSRDGTVSAYSLAPWPSQEVLGASFILRGNSLVLERIDPGSPLWEAALLQGLRLNPGDLLEAFQYDGDQVYDPAGVGAAAFASFRSPNAVRLGTPEVQRILQNPIPRREYLFHFANKGWVVTTARQMPRWKLFCARNARTGRLAGGEWILWRWTDHYYATSTHGDELIGWQITRGLAQTPLFFPAERFRRRFDRPARVHETLENISTPPDWMTFADLVPPAVELTFNPRATQRTREHLVYDLVIKPRDQAIPEASLPDEVTVWLNDQKLDELSRQLRPVLNQPQQIAVPRATLRRGVDNVLTIKLYGKQQTRNEETVVIPNPDPPPQKARLYGFLFGVSDYSQCKPIPQANLASEKSLEFVERWLRTQKGNELYEDVIVERVPEADTTLARFRSSLRSLSAKVRPDDVVVIMLAGHGIGGRKLDEVIKPEAWGGREKSKYLFLLGNFDASRPVETSISDRIIVDELSAVPGYKVVLMDACHASAGFDLMRGLTPENVGPTIFASCAPDEVSWESPALGMGFFTMALVNSTDPKVLRRFGKDNKLVAEDLAKFLEVQVPTVLKRWNPDKQQTPAFEQARPNRSSKPLFAAPGNEGP